MIKSVIPNAAVKRMPFIVLFATTDAPSSAIRSYYRAILPPLGWQGSGDVFRRGPEEVAIKQVNVNGLGLWRIALQPAR